MQRPNLFYVLAQRFLFGGRGWLRLELYLISGSEWSPPPVCTFTRPPLRCRSCALRLCVQNSRTAPFGCWTPPPSQAPGPFLKLVPLATRPCRDLGAAHLRALWDVSRLTGQKGETPCRPNRPSPFSVPSATQPLAALPRPDASTPPSGSPSSANGTSRLSLQRRCLRQTGPLRQAAPSRYPHQASRTGAVSARQHREHPTPHRDLRATGKSGRTVAHTSPSDPSFPLFDNPSWLFRRDDFPQADFPLPDPPTNRLPTLSENRSAIRPLLRHVQHDRTNSTP